MAGLLASVLSGPSAGAQPLALDTIVFDIPCRELVGTTPADAQRFTATAVMAFAGYIAGRATEAQAREMLTGFATLVDEFEAVCASRTDTLRDTMEGVIERYLDGH